MSVEEDRVRSARALVAPGVVAALAVGGFLALAPQSIPDSYAALPDLSTSYQFAMHCLWEDECALALGFTARPTTPFGVQHGALANHLFAVVLAAGGDLFIMAWIQVAASALALVLLVLVTSRYAGVAWTPAAAFVYFALGHPADYPYFIVWNAGFAALPAVAVVAGTLAYQETGRRGFLVGAALALGIGLQLHQVMAASAPALAWAAWAAPAPATRRWIDLGLAAAVCFVVVGLGSYGVLSTIEYLRPPMAGTADVAISPWAVVASVALGVGLVAAGLSPVRRRSPLMLAATWLPLFALVAVAGASLRYLRPFHAAVTLLGVLATKALLDVLDTVLPEPRGRMVRRLGPAAATAIAVALFWNPLLVGFRAPPARGIADAECRRLSRLLQREAGWGYDEMFRHVRGAEALPTLLHCLAGHTPAYDGALPDPPDAVVLHRPAAAPSGPGWYVEGDPPEWAVRFYEPALDWSAAEACVSSPLEDCGWRRVPFERGGRGSRRLREPARSPSLLLGRRPPRPLHYRVPLRAEDRARWLVVPALGPGEAGCGAAVVEVRGREVEGSLPGAVVRIAPGEAAEVVLESVLTPPCRHVELFPAVAEADDAGVRSIAEGLGRSLPFEPPPASPAAAPVLAPTVSRGRPRGVLDLSLEPTAPFAYVAAALLAESAALLAFVVWWPWALFRRG